LFFFAFPVLASEDVITWKDDVKGWYIGVDLTTGDAGLGCFMVSSFEDGTFLRLQFDPNFDEGIQLYLGNEDWQSLEEGKIYALDIQVGNQPYWIADAEGIYWNDGMNVLSVPLSWEDDSGPDFIEEFMRYLTIDFIYNGNSIAFLNLKGTYAATLETLDCVLAVNEDTKGTQKDPFKDNTSQINNDPFS